MPTIFGDRRARRIAALLPLILLLAAEEPAAFEPSALRFADAAGCKSHLGRLVLDARRSGHVAVQGPYDMDADDVRVHMVSAQGSGHRIEEHRCLGSALSGRAWEHVMQPAEEPFTIESAARQAEWLKKEGREQQ